MRLRFALALGIAFLVALLVHLLDTHHPQFRGSISARTPSLGVPVKIEGIDASPASRSDPPPIAARFSAMTVERLESGSGEGDVEIAIPVEVKECPRLVHAFGGECGAFSGDAPAGSDELELSAGAGAEQVAAEVRLPAATTAEVTPTGARTAAGIPTSWSLESDAAVTQVRLACGETALRIVAATAREVRCAYGGVEFKLPLLSEEELLPSLELISVESLEVALAGEAVTTSIREGEISRGVELEQLQSAEPIAAELHAEDPNLVELALGTRAGVESATLEARSQVASAIKWDGDDHTRSYLERYESIVYALIGVVGGFLLVSLAEVVLDRRR